MRRAAVCFVGGLLILSLPITCLQAKEKVNLIYASISGLFLGTWVAQEAGYFDREGLNVNLVYVQSAGTALQAMMAGEAPLVMAGGEPVVESGLKGGDAVFIAGVTVVPAVHFLAVPEIRSIQDLRGKPVGVTRYGSSTDFAMREVLRRNGLEPVRDLPVLQIAGGHRALAAALLKRAVYAATIAPPNSLRAEQGGAKLLVDMAKAGIYFPYSSIITTRSYLKRSRPIALAFMKGYSEGLRRMVSDKAFSLIALKKYMRDDDPEILETTYQYALDYIVRIPFPTKEGIAEVLRQSKNPQAKSAAPENFIDDSLVRELEQKGAYR